MTNGIIPLAKGSTKVVPSVVVAFLCFIVAAVVAFSAIWHPNRNGQLAVIAVTCIMGAYGVAFLLRAMGILPESRRKQPPKP